MPVFVWVLLAGFVCNCASAFTTFYSHRWGERAGRWTTAILRNVLGIPVWVIGLGLAVRTPSSALFEPSDFSRGLAWGLLLLGSVVQVLALVALRRRAAAPSTSDALERRGPYAYLRHPIYAGLLLEFAGIVLDKPTLASLLACGLGVVWVVLQARFEEIDLLQRLPAYRAYMGEVARFWPWGLKASGALLFSELGLGFLARTLVLERTTFLTGCAVAVGCVMFVLPFVLLRGDRPLGRRWDLIQRWQVQAVGWGAIAWAVWLALEGGPQEGSVVLRLARFWIVGAVCLTLLVPFTLFTAWLWTVVARRFPLLERRWPAFLAGLAALAALPAALVRFLIGGIAFPAIFSVLATAMLLPRLVAPSLRMGAFAESAAEPNVADERRDAPGH